MKVLRISAPTDMRWAGEKKKKNEIIYNFDVAPLSLSPYGQLPLDKNLQAEKRRWDNAFHSRAEAVLRVFSSGFKNAGLSFGSTKNAIK